MLQLNVAASTLTGPLHQLEAPSFVYKSHDFRVRSHRNAKDPAAAQPLPFRLAEVDGSIKAPPPEHVASSAASDQKNRFIALSRGVSGGCRLRGASSRRHQIH